MPSCCTSIGCRAKQCSDWSQGKQNQHTWHQQLTPTVSGRRPYDACISAWPSAKPFLQTTHRWQAGAKGKIAAPADVNLAPFHRAALQEPSCMQALLKVPNPSMLLEEEYLLDGTSSCRGGCAGLWPGGGLCCRCCMRDSRHPRGACPADERVAGCWGTLRDR